MSKVGIDDIEAYVPRLYVDSKDFASWRNPGNPEELLSKMNNGIGISKMAIPDSNQDPATMAANAALRLIQRNNIKPEDIGRLYVATESAVDESKAMNSLVVGMLEQVYGEDSFEHAGGVEFKFACVSGSFAIQDNANWIRAGEHDGKSALVIATDVAKYDIGSPGELTQGAAATAFLIKEYPRLMAFDQKVVSTSVGNDYDFYRPFGKKTPIVEGNYSNMKYLMRVGKAYKGYKDNVIKTKTIEFDPTKEALFEHIEHFNPHIPYPKMANTIMSAIIIGELRGGFKADKSKALPAWKDLEKEIGDVPVPSAKTLISLLSSKDKARTLSDDKEYMKTVSSYRRKLSGLEIYNRTFSDKIASGLEISRIVGNGYTTSAYLGTLSTLEYENKKGTDLHSHRILFGSYGSGSEATVFSGVVQENYKDVVGRMNFEQSIGNRRRLTLEEYENLHEGRLDTNESILDYSGEFVLRSIGSKEDKMPKRTYKMVPKMESSIYQLG